MKILSNQRHCEICQDSPYSAYRHDYKTCSCGRVMVDGGMDYLRHSGKGINLSIVVSDKHFELLMDAVGDPSRNTLGHLCNIVRVLRDDMGVNLSDYSKDPT